VDETYKQMMSTATFLVENVQISDLGKVISSFPSALLLDRDTQIRPSLEFLMTVVGIDMDEIPRIIESFPLLLAANVTNMDIATQYLLSLEVSPDVIGSIVRAFPSILTLSVEEKMMPVVAFLKQIGVTNIGRFVT
jgi:mTERF domain-containing protein